MRKLLSFFLFFLCTAITVQALDLRPTVSPWLEDGTNTYLRLQRNVCIGIGPTATDALSLCTAPVASTTRALFNLSNTALSAASANGTYLGANPAACTGDFFNFQVAGVSKASLTCAGILTTSSITTALTNTHIFVGSAANIATDVAASGDLTLANTGAFTLVNTAATVGSFGSSTSIPTFTVDAKGRLTASGSATPQLTITNTYFSSLAGTNLTGTAASLTSGNVTTNANLTGHVTSVGNAAVLGSFTSAQLATAITNETGSGLAVFNNTPTLIAPLLGTPTSGVATNITGLPLTTGVTGTLPIANGGTGTAATLTGLVRGNASAMTAAELSGDVTTSGSNATTIANSAVTSAKMNATTTTCTNQAVTAISSGAVGTCTTLTSAYVDSSIGAYTTGTFTITGTGFTVNPTGTARWAKSGTQVQLFIPDLSGTSNATTFTLTGLPAAITPTRLANQPMLAKDNGVQFIGFIQSAVGSTTLSAYTLAAANAWVASGTKTLNATMLSYNLE